MTDPSLQKLTGGTYTAPATGGSGLFFPTSTSGVKPLPSQEDAIGEVYTWEVGGKKYNDFVSKLRKWGYYGPSEQIKPTDVWAIWTGAVSATYTMYNSSGGKNFMTPEQYLSVYAGPAKGPELPTKQINQIDPATKAAIVRSVYQSKLGRNETPEELADELAKIDKGIAAGQTATTKVVGGKNVTTYTPAYSGEVAQQNIGAGIESATEGPVAQDLREKQSLDFMTFLNGLKG